MKNDIEKYMIHLQHEICTKLEQADGKAKFHEDQWKREDGGGGKTRTIQDGNVIEKGGVAFSAVHGPVSVQLQRALEIPSTNEEIKFYATGVSIVLHPSNPHVPIIHMNVRYFELSNGLYWFGGGIDLTPHYIHEDEAIYFHKKLKMACDKHDMSYYPKYKEWADNYFFLPHRNETRGIGGIFFDRLAEPNRKQENFAFVKEIGNSFASIYIHYMNKNKEKPYTEAEKKWQLLRRGRYVEFNLIHDRGTKFGLESNGRTESILMSMPPHADWNYNYVPDENTPEARTQAMLIKGIDWAYREPSELFITDFAIA